MPEGSYRIILAMGGFFVLLGIVFILWNRREKKKYYNSILVTRRDIKETITHEHERFWLQAWQTGGWVSIVVGVVLLIIGAVIRHMPP